MSTEHKCWVCGQMYRERSHLETHVRRGHPDLPFNEVMPQKFKPAVRKQKRTPVAPTCQGRVRAR